MNEHRNLTRRQALGVGLAALLPATMGQGASQDPELGQLNYPEMAGRPRNPVTDYQNDPFIIAIERRLKCTCGCNLDVYTCRTTDFTCETSPAMHRQVVAMVEDDKTGQEIIDAFIAEHGETILMAPLKQGFNWAGYLVPGILITLTGGIIATALMIRHRREAPVAAAAQTSGLSQDDEARLRAELERLDA